MTSSAGLPPAGWYPDPADSSGQRWWNGAAWTEQTTPTAAAAKAGPGATGGAAGGGLGGSSDPGRSDLGDVFGRGAPGAGTDVSAGYGGVGPSVAGDPKPSSYAGSSSAGGAGGYSGSSSAGGAGGYAGYQPGGAGGSQAGAERGTSALLPAAGYDGPPVLVVTTEQAPGHEIRAVHGEVVGIVVRPRSAFAAAGATFAPGTEANGYASLLQAYRREAIDELRSACHGAGGNAVLGTRVSSSEIADYLFQITAEGTAATLDPAP